ncbi:MAG: hypothetical protein WC595_02600 [Candidatus Nanoarchaeia archaeon]
MAQNQFQTVNFVIPVRRFKPFEGANHKRMPELLTGKDANGMQVDIPREIISPKQLMEARLGRIGTESDQTYLRTNYVNTNVAVLPDPNGDAVKLVPRHSLIYGLNPTSELEDYNLPITKDQFEAAEGFVLQPELANTLRKDPYAVSNRRTAVWEFLAEGDTSLRKAYEEDVTKTLEMPFEKVMCVYVPLNKGMRLLGVDDNYGSDASGYDNLDSSSGRLVGVAPEAQGAQKNGAVTPNLEQLIDLVSPYVAQVNLPELRKQLTGAYVIKE